ncbi:MAG: cytochrome C oxidase subunit IV family protein [Thermoanaerobaculia bacterium]
MSDPGEHATSIRTYLLVFGALMLGTAITVWVAFFDLGVLNNVVALGIALIKATLVVLFFMHLAHASRLAKLVCVAGFFWLLILFGITLTDYSTREFLENQDPVATMPAPPGVE